MAAAAAAEVTMFSECSSGSGRAKAQAQAPGRIPLLFSLIFLDAWSVAWVACWGAVSAAAGLAPARALLTPALYHLALALTQKRWCALVRRWGRPRAVAALALVVQSAALGAAAAAPPPLLPLLAGAAAGVGASLLCAQLEAVEEAWWGRWGGSGAVAVGAARLAAHASVQALTPHALGALVLHYGLQPALLLLAALVLQPMPAALLLRLPAHSPDTAPAHSFSRYSDVSKNYAVFENAVTSFPTVLQLHDLSTKSWRSPSDGAPRADVSELQAYDNSSSAPLTPPSSPEGRRRNVHGVEILPEIPEDSEDSERADQGDSSDNKQRLNAAIKRLSIMGDNFSEHINRQIRRDSENGDMSSADQNVCVSGGREYSEVQVRYERVSGWEEARQERMQVAWPRGCGCCGCGGAAARVCGLLRRAAGRAYGALLSPLVSALCCWRFYPAVLLWTANISVTAVSLVLQPLIAIQMERKIPLTEANFMMSLHAFACLCFLLSTPWFIHTPKRNFKYIATIGLAACTAACFLLWGAHTHDVFAVGSVVGGVGCGALGAAAAPATRALLGRRGRRHPAVSAAAAGALLASAAAMALSRRAAVSGPQHPMLLLGAALAAVTALWSVLCLVSLYRIYVNTVVCRRR